MATGCITEGELQIMEMLGQTNKLLQTLIQAVNLNSALSNPKAFVLTGGKALNRTITKGTPEVVFTNTRGYPMLVNVRAATGSNGTEAYLIITVDQENEAEQDKAPLVESTTAPHAEVILPSSAKLVVDISSGDPAATATVVVTPVGLPGYQAMPEINGG